MRTGTAATRETVSQAWSPVLTAAGVEGQELGRQILALAHQVAVHSLPAPLTDPGREPEDKVALARRLFTGTVDERVVDLLSARSWLRSRPRRSRCAPTSACSPPPWPSASSVSS